MKKGNEAVVCRQCGKIIVGSSKFGLCESCANKDTGYALIAGGVGGLLLRAAKKVVPLVNEVVSKRNKR